MEKVKEIVAFILTNWVAIITIIAGAYTTATTLVVHIVHWTPTLKDNNALLTVLKAAAKITLVAQTVNHNVERAMMLAEEQRLLKIPEVPPTAGMMSNIPGPDRVPTEIINGVEVPIQ